MGGLVESVSGDKRVQAILLCWLAPLIIGAFAFVIIVLPDVRGTAVVGYLGGAARTLHANRFLLVFGVSLAVATFMFINRLPLWRVLEGYLWPGWLKRWRVARAHAPQAKWLRAKLFREQADRYLTRTKSDLEKAQQSGAANPESVARAVRRAEKRAAQWSTVLGDADENRKKRGRERWPIFPRRAQPLFTLGRPEGGDGEWIVPYPSSDDRIMPTKLGNVMRSMEAYGAEKYGLDSQIMWFELIDVAPASLQSALEDVALQADALVCAIYTALALAAVALAGWGWRLSNGVDDTKLWVTSAASLVLALVMYRGLLGMALNWAFAVKTLVDGSRDALREKLGLRAPVSAADEKRMWTALVGSRWYDFNQERESVLAEYQVRPADSNMHGLRRLLRTQNRS